MFNLGLSVSQEIPICASLDYDEAGEAHFLPRSNSMSLFPGLPFFGNAQPAVSLTPEQPTHAPPTTTEAPTPYTSLLCLSSELSEAESKEEQTEPSLKRKNVCHT